jgi:hypothetical protein
VRAAARRLTAMTVYLQAQWRLANGTSQWRMRSEDFGMQAEYRVSSRHARPGRNSLHEPKDICRDGVRCWIRVSRIHRRRSNATATPDGSPTGALT